MGARKNHLKFSECEDLIKHVLTVDCNKRFTMDQIISHHWMQIGEDDTDFENVIREYNRPSECDPDIENLNETVLEHMENVHEFDRESTIKVRKYMS